MIEALFTRALDLPPAKRDELLAAACPDDDELRREVRKLLEAHEAMLAEGDEGDRFLERLDAERAAALIEPAEVTDLLERLQSALGTTYRVERELRGAGMSRVFAAEEHSLGRKVVVKVLPPELSSAISVERFRREITFAARLEHPHIVPLLIAGEAGELLYYTMPFVEGESLGARLAREGALPVREVVRLLREVADALAYAHRHGVVHRDIKPANVLLSDGHARVSDFGVAKALSTAAGAGPVGPVTAAGVALGTPNYMAPEQVAADPEADHRADVYALGVLAYEMIAGRPPFSGNSPQEVLAVHATRAPEPVARSRPNMSPELAALVMRCLEHHPADRPQSADEVLRQLESLGTDTGSTESSSSSARKLRRAAAYVGVPAALLAGYLAFSLLARQPLRRAEADPAARRSIAVLPFMNLSSDKENEYFSDGMTEELINALSKVSGLRVAARTSSFAFKGKSADVREIGRRLGVGTVLEGSVRKAGTKLRITVQLVDASDGYHVWSEEYDRELSDVFTVQNDIAQAIAGALEVRLAGDERASLVRPPTGDLGAYELFLKGRFATYQRTSAALAQAVRFFEQAVARDSSFAEAYAGLAEVNVILPFYTATRPAAAWAGARAAAERALALDSTLAGAHAALAYGKAIYEWDWAGAERGFRRAIALDPRYAIARIWHGLYLMGRGRMADGVREYQIAHQLEPLSLLFNTQVGVSLYLSRRYDEAATQLQQTLQLDPNSAIAHGWLGYVYLQMGMPDRAITEFERAEALNERRAQTVAGLVYAHSAAGNRRAAEQLLAELLERSRTEYVSPVILAIAYTGLGDRAHALRWLETAADVRDLFLMYMWMMPAFDPLRPDPRFTQVLNKLGVS
jgi:eukaryotic-like serine/threonine-protein kinase